MQDWKDGKIYHRKYGSEVWVPVTPELVAMDPEDRRGSENLYTYDEFWESLDDGWSVYKGFEKSYTTPNGEKVFAFGYYGGDR